MMDSSDRMIVVIGGREYFIEGDTLMPSQRSFEHEVLTRLDGIESRLGKLESRAGALETEVGFLRHDQANLQTSVYWVLAAIGLYLAMITLPPFILGLFRKWTGSDKPSVSQGFSIQDVIAILSWNDQHRNSGGSHSEQR